MVGATAEIEEIECPAVVYADTGVPIKHSAKADEIAN